MQQRAFQAALALYRLPAAERRGAISRILAEHSSPSRRLVWNEQNSSIGFARYSKHQTESSDIPVNLTLNFSGCLQGGNTAAKQPEKPAAAPAT